MNGRFDNDLSVYNFSTIFIILSFRFVFNIPLNTILLVLIVHTIMTIIYHLIYNSEVKNENKEHNKQERKVINLLDIKSDSFLKENLIDQDTGLYSIYRCKTLFEEKNNNTQPELPTPTTPTLTTTHGIVIVKLNNIDKPQEQTVKVISTKNSLQLEIIEQQVNQEHVEIIVAFAKIFKNSCIVNKVIPFLGRYSYNEFIVDYEDIADEDEITSFIKQLELQIKEFNEKETKFQLSYSIGYSFSNNKDEQITLKQLLNIAYEKMNENHI